MLGVIVVLAAISVWGGSRLGGKGRQTVADIRQAMRAQGFKTDLADFNLTNDAAMQARAAALDLVWSVPELATNQDELELLPAVSNDTATVIWKQDSLKFWKRQQYWDPFSLKIATNNLCWPDFHALLDRNRWMLDQACDAALSGPIRFDADATNGVEMFRFQEDALPSLAQALCRCAMLDLHDDHPDAAWTNLLAATRLVTASVPAPDMDSEWLHSWMAGAAFSDTWQVLQQGDWPDEKLAVLQREWESVNLFTNLVETAAFGYAFDVFACQDESHGRFPDPFSFSRLAYEALVNLSSAHEYISDHVALQLYRHHGLFADEKGLLLYCQKRALQLRRALQATNWAEMRALPGVTNVALFKSSYPPAQSHGIPPLARQFSAGSRGGCRGASASPHHRPRAGTLSRQTRRLSGHARPARSGIPDHRAGGFHGRSAIALPAHRRRPFCALFRRAGLCGQWWNDFRPQRSAMVPEYPAASWRADECGHRLAAPRTHSNADPPPVAARTL